MAQDTSAPSGGMTPYFAQMAAILKLDPNQYHNGSGGGQESAMAMPNSPDTSGSAVDPNDPTSLPPTTAPDTSGSASPMAPNTAPAAAAPTSTAAPTGNAPVSPYTAQDLDVAQKMMPQKSDSDKFGEASRLLGASIYGPQIYNETVQNLDSHDQAQRKAAFDTVTLARDIGEATKQGFELQNLAIAVQNQQTWAKAANDPNSTLTQFTRAAVLNQLDQTQGISPDFKNALKTKIPTMSAFDILNNGVTAQLANVAGINDKNIKNAIALADETTKRMTAGAAVTNAAADTTKANTEARNQTMLEQASGLGGTPAATTNADGTTAPAKPAKYVVEGKGIKLAPAEEARQKADTEEFESVRSQQPDLINTEQHIHDALNRLKKVDYTGPLAEYISKFGKTAPDLQKLDSDLQAVGLDYNRAFAKDAGARAGGNVRVETREANNVGNVSQNAGTIKAALNRLLRSIQVKKAYNTNLMDSYGKDNSLDNFKFGNPVTLKDGSNVILDPKNKVVGTW